VFLDRYDRRALETGLKSGLTKTRAYFALATLYGEANDAQDLYEPQRLDWCRAKFTNSLPDGWELVFDESAKKLVLPAANPLAEACMFVLITEEKVVMVLRGGNKNGQNIDQNLTDRAPNLAAMLRLWMPKARSAQPGEPNPFVIFKTDKKHYGTGFNVHAYSDMIERAWKTAGCNPQDDANKEPKKGKKNVAGFGSGWARKVTGLARRGVHCKAGEQHDNAGAAAQGHSASTERAEYRTL